MGTNQGDRQASVRGQTGTALTYEGDWHALFTLSGIPAGDFNGRFLAFINFKLGTSYTELNGAMYALAVSQGAKSWNELGAITFSVPGTFIGRTQGGATLTGRLTNSLKGSVSAGAVLAGALSLKRALAGTIPSNAALAGALTVGHALDLPFSTMSSGSDLTAKGVTYTSSGLGTQYDSTGRVTWKPNNLMLGSETIGDAHWDLVNTTETLQGDGSTLLNLAAGFAATRQIVPVAPGQKYVVSVEVKLAPTASASAIRLTTNNTQAWDTGSTVKAVLTSTWQRISIVHTAGASDASAFCLIGSADASGNAGEPECVGNVLVRRAQFEAVTYQTTPRPYAATTSAAYYGPRFDYDPVTLAAKGLLIEPAATNILLNATFDAANLATQSVTVSAQAYTLSFYGTGTVTLSGTATGTLTGTGAFPARSTLTFTPTAGTLTLTVSGTVQYAMCAAGSGATSFVPTGAAAVTRAAETASVPIPATVSTIRHTYSDDTTADISVTPSSTYTFPTTQKTYKLTQSVGA